ncbi:MAG: T9SS type A sorting domain-containing protein, partial [Candidatus Cloacimonadaceae bacterium]|nr:T9SS type A sorting domain-containing protein [Candidatus Cloacimonadaceae bacterium]
GSSVGVHHHYGNGQTIVLSFPLYNMKSTDADALLTYVFSSLFSETTEDTSSTVPPIPWAVLSPPYPNPFSNSTSFRIHAKDTLELVDVSIFNLRGQRIRRIYWDYPKASELLNWDGKDASGAYVGSGLYFIKLSQNGRALSRKIMHMK